MSYLDFELPLLSIFIYAVVKVLTGLERPALYDVGHAYNASHP